MVILYENHGAAVIICQCTAVQAAQKRIQRRIRMDGMCTAVQAAQKRTDYSSSGQSSCTAVQAAQKGANAAGKGV